MKPVYVSGQIWHQPAKDGVRPFVYITGDLEGKGGRILFWVDDEVSSEDIKSLSDYMSYL